MAKAGKPAPYLDSGYITWSNEAERVEAFKTLGENVPSYTAARYGDRRYFKDIDQNLNVRPGFTRRDYEYFRPDEQIPQLQKEAIARCMVAYETCGLIKNVIDLMADFACQGIGLVHTNPQVESFYKQWWKKVRGKERSERFLNLLYRAGNVIVKRSTARIKNRADLTVGDFGDLPSPNTVNYDAEHIDIDQTVNPKVTLDKGEIPWRYTFLSPLSLEIVGEDLAAFTGKLIYALRIPIKVRNKIRNPRNEIEKKMVDELPKEVINSLNNSNNLMILDQRSISVYHYKKDDWMIWANPMTFAILNDIILYDKLKLTDIAACDSAISAVRLWRLGDLENKVMPTKQAFDRLSDTLTNNVGGGGFDLIWGPDIDFKESNTQVYKFLGEEKYGPTLNAIYAGLGIPPTLTGSATQSGFTNNYISLKTLTERLQYGRNLITEFWEQEIALIQKAMGFRYPAQIRFDRMTLSDEAAEKALLIQLADRDLISMETILERFDEIPELEKRRMIREQKERQNKKVPDKRSPYRSEQQSLIEQFTGQGLVTPSQVGVDLQPKKPGEKSLVDKNNEHQANLIQTKQTAKTARKGKSGQGRPLNSDDSGKRKTKTVKPRSKAMVEMWAKSALEQVNSLVVPCVLEKLGKKNLRGLTEAEAISFENTKFAMLCEMKPFTEVTPEGISRAAELAEHGNSAAFSLLQEATKSFIDTFNRSPNFDEIRQIQILVYSYLWEDE